MIRRILVAASMLWAAQSMALDFSKPILPVKSMAISSEVGVSGLPWKVGETADYSLNLGFLQGTMKMQVRELNAEGFWVQQDIDLMIQKQKVEILYDKDSGQVKEIRVDGQKQDLPAAGDVEIVESRPDTVTVPAGTFECAYVKVKDKKQNQESELWVNPDLIPILGLIKNVSPSQIGQVTIELTGFEKK